MLAVEVRQYVQLQQSMKTVEFNFVTCHELSRSYFDRREQYKLGEQTLFATLRFGALLTYND